MTYRRMLIILLCLATPVLLASCGKNGRATSVKTQRTVAMVFPVTVDAFVEFRVQAEKEFSKHGVKVLWFSAEGDPSRFSSVVEASLLRKPDVFIPVGTQLTNVCFGPRFKDDLPTVVASCISDPAKVEALKAIGLTPPRKRPVAILSDSPKKDIYSYSASVIETSMGKSVVVGILFNTSEINAQNTARSLGSALEKRNVKVLEGIISGEEDVTRVARVLISKGATLLVIPHDKYVIKKAAALTKLAAGQARPIPVFSLDDGSVRKDGAAFGVSVSYGSLGLLTAKTCMQVLEGERPQDMPIVAEDSARLYVNPPMLDRCRVAMPDRLLHDAVVVGRQ